MQIGVVNYGRQRGIQKYRLSGRKKELDFIIQVIKQLGGRFMHEPLIERNSSSKHPYTVLLEIHLEPWGSGRIAGNSEEIIG